MTRHDFSNETKTCEHPKCGKTFGPNDYELRRPQKWRDRRFCSRGCGNVLAATVHNKGIDVEEEKTCKLPDCDVVFKRSPGEAWSVFAKRKFCRREHALVFARSSTSRGTMDEKNCEKCDKVMKRPEGDGNSPAVRSFKKRKYCSDECSRKARSEKLSKPDSKRNKPAGPPRQRRGINAVGTPKREPLKTFPGPVPETLWRPAGFAPLPRVEPTYRKAAS